MVIAHNTVAANPLDASFNYKIILFLGRT